jgi:hypothetical protein
MRSIDRKPSNMGIAELEPRQLFLYDFPLFDGQARVKTHFPTFDLK